MDFLKDGWEVVMIVGSDSLMAYETYVARQIDKGHAARCFTKLQTKIMAAAIAKSACEVANA